MKRRYAAAMLACVLSLTAAPAYAAVLETAGETEEISEEADTAETAEEASGEEASGTAEETSGTAEEASGTAEEAGKDPEDAGGEDEKPVNPAEAGITAEDAVIGARTLYSQMKHYSEMTDNENFAGCFEGSADAAVIQNELSAVQAADETTRDYGQHVDVCYFDPTSDATQSPYYFGVGLTDYKVNDDGTVEWYSTLLRVAKYGDGWKASPMPEGSLLDGQYPDGFREARDQKRNAADLYPYLALRFSDGAVFEGAFYSLVNMVWQNEDGSISAALYVANGQEGAKWCDSIDLILRDGKKEIASVNVPVQEALQPGESRLCILQIPAEDVKSGTEDWTDLTVSSNLLYQ